MNDKIRNSAYYMNYLALSTNTKSPKATKGKGKGGNGKKKKATSVHKDKKKDAVKKKDTNPRKKSLIISDDNILPHPNEALKLETAESKETKDEMYNHQFTDHLVVIDREAPKKSAKETLVHSQKLKGIKILSEASLYESDMKKAVKAKPLVDDQAGMEQVVGEKAKVQVLDPAVLNPSFSLTLSSAEYGNHFINENPDLLINDILKDRTKSEITSMVDVPIRQEDHVVQRTLLVDIVISIITEKSTPTPPPPTKKTQATLASKSDPSLKQYAIPSTRLYFHSPPIPLEAVKVLEEIVLEVAMGADETIKVVDDVANIKERPQDDATLKQDNSMWFKQDARLETPDPEWH
nr:hypothetical protein [Tanacetum cinerariifolium]